MKQIDSSNGTAEIQQQQLYSMDSTAAIPQQ
jgi:hypothetical protein